MSKHEGAAAAAESFQSCMTLCDTTDGSPPGYTFLGIIQARTLEWVAISFSNAWQWKIKMKSFSLRDPMDCSLPGSSIHGIFQARVLEWGAIAFSKHEGEGMLSQRSSFIKKVPRRLWPLVEDAVTHRCFAINKLGKGEFNSDDHYIYYCRQESLRRNGVAIMVNKRVRNAVLGCNLKNDRMISVPFQGKPFNITVIQVYAPTSNTEEAELNGSMKTYKTFQN